MRILLDHGILDNCAFTIGVYCYSHVSLAVFKPLNTLC